MTPPSLEPLDENAVLEIIIKTNNSLNGEENIRAGKVVMICLKDMRIISQAIVAHFGASGQRAVKWPEKCDPENCKQSNHSFSKCCLRNDTIDACRQAFEEARKDE